MADNRLPGDTTRKGYGGAHQRLRKRWAPLVAIGGVLCARCGEEIRPGTKWDLGHVDGSRKQAYSGPEHRKCNRSAGMAVREAADPDPTPRTRW